MTCNMLPIYRAGYLAILDIKLGDKLVYCIKRDQLLLKRGKVFQLLWIPMLAADKHYAPYIYLWDSASVKSCLISKVYRYCSLAVSL